MIAKEREKFVEGCETTGYGRALGTAWFDIIEPFADYAFNKSHSFGYGFVAYQTAYLKANYPVEYLACLLTSVKANLDRAGVYLNECRQMNIQVTVPDVNLSETDFLPAPDPAGGSAGQIVYGLSAVRNVGEGLVELLVNARNEGGPFTDFYDFCARVDEKVLNKRTVESLIKAGAFDSLDHPRQGLLTAYEEIIDTSLARRREYEMGVQTLFGASTDGPVFDERKVIPDIELDKRTRLAFEKEMLGLYVSDHPLFGAEAFLARRVDCSLSDLADKDENARVTVGGVVTNLVRKWTKRGDLMAVFTIEGLSDSIEAMVFPKTMALWGHLLTEQTNDQVVLVQGRVDKRDDLPKLIVDTVELADLEAMGQAPPLRLRVAGRRCSDDLLADLKQALTAHAGDSPVFLHLDAGAFEKVLRLAPDFAVDTSNGLMGELRALLGAESVLV